MRARALIIVACVFVIGGLVGSWATVKTGRTPFQTTPVSFLVSNAPGEAIGHQVSFTNGFAPVAKAVIPAVVNIASSKMVKTQNQVSPFLSDPFFRQFFGNDGSSQFSAPRAEREHSLGSGVIVNANGYILTNNHVVAGADQIEVSLPDKRQFKGHVVGTDPKTDLAVVRIDATGLTPIVIGDSAQVAVGDFALAVGNPFGVGETVTMGIISATGRSGLGIESYEDFIQTDAAINPGNSGGALVNVQGQLVGINTAIITGGGGGGNQGVGLAIPSNMAKTIMQQIVEHGKVVRGSMGVVIQPVTPELAQAFHLTGQARGALVAQVNPGSPAEKAGLKSGDIILQLNAMPVSDSRDLSLKISTMAPGTVVKLQVLHNGSEENLSVTLAEMSANAPSNLPTAPPSPGGPTGLPLGISIQTLTPGLAQQDGLPPQTKGVLIVAVEPGSAAETAGLQHGDVVLEANHKTVTTADQLRQAIQQSGDQPVLLMIDRGGEQLYVVVQRQ